MGRLHLRLVLVLILPAMLGGLQARAVHCDCDGTEPHRSSRTERLEDWGDDDPALTAMEERARLDRPGAAARPLVQKQGGPGEAPWIDAPAPKTSLAARADDLLRVRIDRVDEYADRDPVLNDSDPYIRLWARPPAAAEWEYLGPSEVVEGCDGFACEAVFEWTLDTPIGRSGLWDVSPEVWDDDGGWSDDELLGYEDFLEIPPAGLPLEWRTLNQDPDWQCWSSFSVEYVDRGADQAVWLEYPVGEVSQAMLRWEEPSDRSGIVQAQIHFSSDPEFGPMDEWIQEVVGESLELDCLGLHPPDGWYHIGLRVQDGAGHWSPYVSPPETVGFFCINPTMIPTPTVSPEPTATPPPQPTSTPAVTPEPTPGTIWYDLIMPDVLLEAGEPFLLERSWGNPTGTTRLVEEYILLEVEGDFWYWPSWRMDPDFIQLPLPAAGGTDEPILQFAWPDGAGALQGIRFWGAFLEPGGQVLVVYDMIEWSYR